MLLGEPIRTPYDLHFSVLGFPVRVHPYFWLGTAICGFSAGEPIYVLIWIVVCFISILIHELGHALMMRRFGREAHIVLHMMGGLAIEGSDSPYSFRSGMGRRSAYEQVLISAAGPGAGFILAGIVVGVVVLAGGQLSWVWLKQIIPFPILAISRDGVVNLENRNLFIFVNQMLYVNIFWGLMNMLPVFPLDGGQIARAVLMERDPWQGQTRSLWLSLITGAAAAIVGAFILQEIYIALLFGSLAYSSYMALQQFTGGRNRPW